jgi:mono/diheme cytochrome c family protein
MKRALIAAAVLLFASTALADGAATFSKKCAICHGKEGVGAKMMPKPIAGTPAAKVLKAIKEGQGKMKPVAIEDAAAVADYVAGLKK